VIATVFGEQSMAFNRFSLSNVELALRLETVYKCLKEGNNFMPW
jgi:hypothetical protein